MAGRACVPELGVSVLPERGTCWGCPHTEARRLPILETPKEEQFFCEQCRDEIRAPTHATRSQRPEQPASRVAKHSAGGWSHSPHCSVATSSSNPSPEPSPRAQARPGPGRSPGSIPLALAPRRSLTLTPSASASAAAAPSP